MKGVPLVRDPFFVAAIAFIIMTHTENPNRSNRHLLLYRAGLWLSLAIGCTALHAQSSPHVRIASDRHSDFSSLADLDSDNLNRLRGPHARNLAYIDDEARIGWTTGAWSFDLLARSSASLVVNRAAVDALHHVDGRTRGGSDATWWVSARLRGFKGAGVEVQRLLDLGPQWRAGVSAQALSLTGLRDRRIDGPVQFDAQRGSYAFDLRSSEVNNRLSFPFQVSQPSSGAGLLFNVDLAWHSPQFGLGASIRDLGWLRWKQLSGQEFFLSSNTRAIDADGFVIYQPLLQGRNSQQARTLVSPRRAALRASWQATPDGALGVSTEFRPGFGGLPAISWSQHWAGLTTSLEWRFHERRATIALAWGALSAKLGVDRLGGDAQSQTFSLGYGSSF